MKPLIFAGLAFGCLVAGGAGGAALAQSVTSSPMTMPAHDTATKPDDRDARAAAQTRLMPGDRVPDDYQQDRYVFATWQAQGLETPPAGYRWLRDDQGGQYLLASRISGRIADAIDQAPAKTLSTAAVSDDGRPAGGAWSRGERLPDAYRGEDQTVGDWKDAGLPRPARGDRWVYIDNHYMLASRQTGIIRDIR